MRKIAGGFTLLALWALLTGCHSENDNSAYIVGAVYGTYVECISPASEPFQVGIEPGAHFYTGDDCPDGEHR